MIGEQFVLFESIPNVSIKTQSYCTMASVSESCFNDMTM